MNLFWMIDLERKASNGLPFLLETLLTNVVRDKDSYVFNGIVLRMAKNGEIPPACGKNIHAMIFPDMPVFLFLHRDEAIKWRDKFMDTDYQNDYSMFEEIEVQTRQILDDVIAGKYKEKTPECIAVAEKTISSVLSKVDEIDKVIEKAG